MHGGNSNNYVHLSQEERYEISIWLREGLSIRKIATKLNRFHSTISREINRNGKDVGYGKIRYDPKEANKQYKKRIDKRNYNHRIFVKEKWKRKWIYDWLKRVDGKVGIDELLGRYYLEKGERLCSTSTVYNWIRDVGGEAERLIRHKGFGYHKRGDDRKKGKYKDIPTIEKRSKEINKRLEIGHFECDTVVSGRDGKGGLVTLIDRKSRYEIIRKVDDLKGETVRRAMKEVLKGKKIKSLTIDNGGEFSKIRSFKKKGIAIYRCHAYSSWEKGTNERHNGMIRWRIPKGYDISLIDEESIAKIEEVLNHKPRKILGYRTPYEVYHSINLKYFN